MYLFIVESPTKAKTIAKYLGKDFTVVATKGHIKDLPTNQLGVDLNDLSAKYVWIKGKKTLMDRIKKLATKAKAVYIATDPDREGEAIAFFVKDELRKYSKNIYRVRFYEITKEAIKNSIEQITDVDTNLVKAQFARRILDRLIGYTLSPKVSRKLGLKGLSVGRVQSPALRLIVEREEQIKNFKKRTYYYIRADFEVENVEFTLEWDYRFEKPENAQPFLKKLKESLFQVSSIKKLIEDIAPPKPFITASLQSEVSKALKLSVDQVQKIAQDLYELGYITYPRTDSYRINEEKAKEFMNYIEKVYGKEYVGKLRVFKEKPTSFSAHECIRPTSIKKDIKIKEKHKQVYDFILRRTLASLSSPIKLEKLEISAKPLNLENAIFTGKFQRIVHDGWSKIYPVRLEQQQIPNLEEGEILKPKKVYLHRVDTSPPERYTEGSLVKKLESLGIGRPSTYATIVKTLKQRGYIFLEKGYLKPTDIAFTLTDVLKENYQKVIDYDFTKYMEEQLDKIEEGKEDYKKVVRFVFEEIVLR